MNAATQHKVLAILTAIIVDESGNEPTSWKEIVDVVSDQVKVKNWLDVRGILQYMLNEKMIARVQDVMVEKYYKLPATAKTMFAIEIHGGFKIKGYMEQFRNCSVTANIDEALKFETAAAAKQFIVDHHMNGTNKKTNKVIPA